MGSMGTKGRLERAVLAWVLAMAGACSPANPSADVALVDASAEGAMDSASGTCTSNRDCDDQLFCNGVERCMPGSAGANARGCTTGTPPCAAGNRCSEALAQCMGPPSDGGGEAGSCDEDGDGVQGPQCGGLDCDDHDPYRAPNQRERCDGMLPNGGPAAAHDEDCDPCTVSGSAPDGDSDGDGYARTACINPWRSAAAPTGCDVRLAVVPASSTVRGQDCNDDPAMRGAQQNPGTAEVCGNGVDDNCDGLVDNEGAATWFEDRDGDGYGNSGMSVSGCARPDGGVWVQRGGDCNDNNADYHPGAPELCDGFDNNCDRTSGTPGGPDPAEDGDGDGHTSVSVLCIGAGEPGAPAGVTLRPHDDCDDRAADTYGGAPEYCDRRDTDCSLPGTRAGGADVSEDNDADGHAPARASCLGRGEAGALPSSLPKDDCDDDAPLTYTGATELCDGRDNNCSLPMSAAGGPDPSEDSDGDGHSPRAATCLALGAPGAPTGVTLFPADDCNDALLDTHPGAPEFCDRRDTDCSLAGVMAGGVDTAEDADNDGHSPSTASCLGRGDPGAPSTAFPRDDCADFSSTTYPGALEFCDGRDSDCSLPGAMAGSSDPSEDADYDRHSAPSAACVPRSDPRVPASLASLVYPNDDCDEGNSLTYGGATEYCDGRDNDCSLPGSMAGGPVPAEDQDGDGHSGAAAPCIARGERSGAGSSVYPRDDCDDSQQYTYGGAPELCDRRDNNCSLTGAMAGGVDTAEDADNDGHAPTSFTCIGLGEAGAPMGLALLPHDDCGDSVASVYRGAPEYCNRRDDDCSLAGAAAGGVDAAEDADNDGHAPLTASCLPASTPGAPAGTMPADDCNDASAAAFPSAPELCDGLDNNCDARVDEEPVASASCGGRMVCATGHCDDRSALGGGFNYGCALRGGATYCWGSGTLGDGTAARRYVDTPVQGLSDLLSLSTASNHACARRADGTVVCWGRNQYGQLGDGSTTDRATPVPVSGLANVTQVAASPFHTCAVQATGSVWCWGNGSSGALGNGAGPLIQSTPVRVSNLTDAVSVTAGRDHSCARRANGTVVCWGLGSYSGLGDGSSGRNVPGPVPGLANVVDVQSYDQHTCARQAAGTVWCWGSNSYGQLGNGGTASATPVPVTGLSDALQVGVGLSHSCALRAGGVVSCWGRNSSGQLGDGTIGSHSTPVVVAGLANATDLGLGDVQTCALTATGETRCWGYGSAGTLGDNLSVSAQTTPTTVLRALSGSQLSVNNFIGCLTGAGRVFCWGFNGSGQLGDGTFTTRAFAVPAVGLTDAIAVAAGSSTTCARRATGAVSCWGDNTYGQLGDGTTNASAVPVAVPSLGTVAEVAVGAGHVCARLTSGSVLCLGANYSGQLGDGTTLARSSPVPVVGLTDAVELSLRSSYSCARRATGEVLCWGANGSGQLGDGTTTDRSTPQAVVGLSNAVALSAGSSHTCAARSDGTAVCWGANSSGQLGDGTSTQRLVPTAVSGLLGAVGVAAGRAHSCARLSGGTLSCWGYNQNGELGTGGGPAFSTTPLAVPSLAGVTGVDAYYQSCALAAGGAAWCWGVGGGQGPLGNNVNTTTASPVRVLTAF